jgi:ribosomal protein S21
MSRDTPKRTTQFNGSKVYVNDGNVEKALRKFKNKIQESGKLEEVRERMEYVKPNIAKTQAKNKARRRHLKQVEADEMAGRRPARDGSRKRLF